MNSVRVDLANCLVESFVPKLVPDRDAEWVSHRFSLTCSGGSRRVVVTANDTPLVNGVHLERANTLKRVLVGLNGSWPDEVALEYALALVQVSQGTLALARVVPSMGDAATLAENRRTAEAELAARATHLVGQGLTVETIVAVGNIVDLLVDEARYDADLLVLPLGRQPSSGPSSAGDTAEVVLARSPVPVLIVPETAPPVPLVVGASPRLLVPLDGSPAAEAALPVARRLAQDLGAEVLLVGVVDLSEPATPHAAAAWDLLPQDLPLPDEQLTAVYLDGVVSALRSSGVAASRAVEVGHAVDGILDAVERANAALIVLTTHGRTANPQIVLGHVARDILHRTNRPAGFVRPDATSDAASRSVLYL